MQHEVKTQAHEIKSVTQTTCCIVGGGPAGAVLALLLARKGVEVMLLEAHMDFEREFRGDTIHASVMEIMDEIGLADRLLQIRHEEAREFTLNTSAGTVTLANLKRLKTKYPYVTVMAQAKFLDFITSEAKRYPEFHLVMGAQVDELLMEEGAEGGQSVRGVRYRGVDGWHEIHAILTVGADGRFSRLRRLSGFEPIKTAPMLDILWFRLSHKDTDKIDSLGGRLGAGMIAAVINRFDYWQVGYVIPKGQYQVVRAAGLPELQKRLAKLVPQLADRVDELKDWKQISVLSVESDRLPRWYRPGLLLIGDAAHVMSPVGGVGINYAIQDAVVAANILADKLKYGVVQTSDLARVQRERELPTRILQAFQAVIQNQVLAQAMTASGQFELSPVFRFFLRLPLLRDIPGRMIAFGPFPAHVRKE